MGSGQRFTSDPQFALAYYYCCGNSKPFEFGDEPLNGTDGEGPCERWEQMFGDYPKSVDVATYQKLVGETESGSTDTWTRVSWEQCR